MSYSYNLEELVSKSIMSGVPSIFVEGRDDIKIYQSLLSLDNCDLDIYPAEVYVNNNSGGCKAVVSVINSIIQLSSQPPDKLKKLILGIVDKDVTDYRNECVSSELIYYLELYSIESYFINEYSLKEIFSNFTSADSKLLNNINYDYFFSLITLELIDRLLLISLECLKKSLNSNYDSNITYKLGSWTSHKNHELVKKLHEKESELIQLKNELEIPDGLLGLQFICKGKWLIENFADLILDSMNNLSSLCEENSEHIKQCIYCETGKVSQCLFKVKAGVNRAILIGYMKSFLNHNIFNNIKSRINILD